MISRSEYRALDAEAQYYRLHWLLREMGSPPLQHLWALVQAGWQVHEGSAVRNRYLAEFALQMAALPAEPANPVEFAMRGRWLNALRELGRFDEEAALLARTSLEPLRRPTQDEQERRERSSWLEYYGMLGRLIERRDSAAEPLDSISSREAIGLCIDRADRLTRWDRAFCEEKAADVERLRRMRSGQAD